MPQVPHRWSPEEDEILRSQVTLHLAEGAVRDWQRIASQLPGRTNKDCRKRWHNVVSGGLNKGYWTKTEDHLLDEAVKAHGQSWTVIASVVKSRNADQCSKRWKQFLNPELNHSQWTDEENQRLMEAHAKKGSRWKEIQMEYFPKRSRNTIRNQYTILSRRGRYNTASPRRLQEETDGKEETSQDQSDRMDEDPDEALSMDEDDSDSEDVMQVNHQQQPKEEDAKPNTAVPTSWDSFFFAAHNEAYTNNDLNLDPLQFLPGQDPNSLMMMPITEAGLQQQQPYDLPMLPELDPSISLSPELDPLPPTTAPSENISIGHRGSTSVAFPDLSEVPGKITLTVENPTTDTTESLMRIALNSQSKLILERD